MFITRNHICWYLVLAGLFLWMNAGSANAQPENDTTDSVTHQKPDIDQDNSDNVVIRAKWRAGEHARYEFTESVEIYSDGEKIEDRVHRTVIHVDVAAVHGSDGFVLLWRPLQTDAPLFKDDMLDSHMYGLIADGIVIHTDRFGGYDFSSNVEYLYDQFEHAIEFLDERNHWDERKEEREEIQAYIDYPELFEELLIRDMRFMFGLHGVQVYFDEMHEYETWQQNPWGEPIESIGKLFVTDYDSEKATIRVTNRVELPENSEKEYQLAETQYYEIFLDSGWISRVELIDEIIYDDFIRNRRVLIKKLPN